MVHSHWMKTESSPNTRVLKILTG